MSVPTIAQMQAAVVAEARRWEGYAPGNHYSHFGVGKNWNSSLTWENHGPWCNRFYSWCFHRVLGREAALAAIGRQPGVAQPVGYLATWLHREWFISADRWVGWNALQPGDAVFWRYPTNRHSNATNHVDMGLTRSGANAALIGGNVPRPGVPASDQGAGGGVWSRLQSPNASLIAVYRPDWQAARAVLLDQQKGSDRPPRPTPPPTPPPERNWFEMATEADLRRVVRAEINGLPRDVWREEFTDPLNPGRSISAATLLRIMHERVWQTMFSDPVTGERLFAGTFLRHAARHGHLEQAKAMVSALGDGLAEVISTMEGVTLNPDQIKAQIRDHIDAEVSKISVSVAVDQEG